MLAEMLGEGAERGLSLRERTEGIGSSLREEVVP
jgi:hypothetical protein